MCDLRCAICDVRFLGFRRSLRSRRNGDARRVRGENGRRQEAIAESHVLSAAAHLPSRAAAPHHSAKREALSGIPLRFTTYDLRFAMYGITSYVFICYY